MSFIEKFTSLVTSVSTKAERLIKLQRLFAVPCDIQKLGQWRLTSLWWCHSVRVTSTAIVVVMFQTFRGCNDTNSLVVGFNARTISSHITTWFVMNKVRSPRKNREFLQNKHGYPSRARPAGRFPARKIMHITGTFTDNWSWSRRTH